MNIIIIIKILENIKNDILIIKGKIKMKNLIIDKELIVLKDLKKIKESEKTKKKNLSLKINKIIINKYIIKHIRKIK